MKLEKQLGETVVLVGLRPDDGYEAESSLSMPEALSLLRKKLEQGDAITYVVFGDSIRTGTITVICCMPELWNG